MNKETKNILNSLRYIKKFSNGMIRGILSASDNPISVAVISCFITSIFILSLFKNTIWLRMNNNVSIPYGLFNTLYWLIVFGLALIIPYLLSCPITNSRFERGFMRVGMCNKADEPPFVRKFQLNKDKHLWIIDFDSTGIPIEHWREKEAEIETALNVVISNIKPGCNRNRVIVECVPAKNGLSEYEPWDDSYISDNNFEIAIGKSALGIEYANLDITSHALIAGSTGSGKTIELKCILYQCIKKGAQVFLVDFKGGANFPRTFKQQVFFVLNDSQFSTILDHVLEHLETRKELLASHECENINEYNRRFNNHMERIIIAIDELAECFDKSGFARDEKLKIQELEHKLATICRLGRAYGIHVIAGLQRPSSDVLNGQIKSQMDLRLCGRSDDVLSQIVLDNTDASRKIGKNERGRFVTNDGRTIQGFFFTDSDLKF